MKEKGRGKGSKGSKGQDRPEMWDAVALLTLQRTIQHRCWEAASLQTLLIPSKSPVVKAMREAGQQYPEEVQAADAQRKRDLGPPPFHVFAVFLEGGKGLFGSSDAAPRHGPGLDGLHDEIGTSFFETWWKDQLRSQSYRKRDSLIRQGYS